MPQAKPELSEEAIVRVRIDGRWTASEMGRFFILVDRLYKYRYLLAILHGSLPGESSPLTTHKWSAKHFRPTGALKRIRKLDPSVGLDVVRVRYESPGFQDFGGLSAIAGHIKDFLLALLKWAGERKQRKLSDEEQRLKNHELKITIAREYIELLNDITEISPTRVQQIELYLGDVIQEISDLVNAQKITGVEIDPHSDDDSDDGDAIDNGPDADDWSEIRAPEMPPTRDAGDPEMRIARPERHRTEETGDVD